MLLLVGTLGFVAAGALAWVVLLGGLSAVNDKMEDFNETFGSSRTNFNVGDLLGLSWWMVWYHFFLLIGVALSAALGTLRQHALLLGNFMAALFALQMTESHAASRVVRMLGSEDFSGLLVLDSFRSRFKAFLAGCILCAISTAALIVWLGLVVPLNTDADTTCGIKAQDKLTEGKLATHNESAPAVAHHMHAAATPPRPFNSPSGHGTLFSAPTATGSSIGGAYPPPAPPIPSHVPQGVPHIAPPPIFGHIAPPHAHATPVHHVPHPGGHPSIEAAPDALQPPLQLPLPPAGATAYGHPAF